MSAAGRPPAITFLRVPAMSQGRAADYERWYDGTHIALRMTMPGFEGAQRYDALTGAQRYIVIYELADALAPEGDEYVRLRAWEASRPADSFEAPALSRPGFERGIYEQRRGPQWPSAVLQGSSICAIGHGAATSESLWGWLSGAFAPRLEALSGVTAVRQFEHVDHAFGAGTGLLTPYPWYLTIVYASDVATFDVAALRAMAAAPPAGLPTADDGPYLMTGRHVFGARSTWGA